MNHDDWAVVWSTRSLGELADLWADSDDRAGITLAATGIDEALSRQPEIKGRAIAEGLRRIRIGPLLVFFEINEPLGRVEVVAVTSSSHS